MTEKAQKLGKYEIIEEIGRGAYAVVYKARHVDLDHVRALKVMHPQLLGEPDLVKAFQREARSTVKLDHPNIVTVYDVGEAEGRHYIAMKYLRGRNLREVIEQEGPLPAQRSLNIIKQAASALDYAHDMGYIHRDIKPSNVIVDDEGRVTVTDFGVARAIGTSTFTSSREMVGTWPYAPPEMFREQELDRRADEYALGAVLYEMLLGRRPFESESPEALITKILMEEPPFPTEMPEGLSEEVKAVVLEALAKDPEHRYATAGALAEAFAEAVRASEEKEGQRNLARLYSRAQKALEEERWSDTLALCEQIEAIQPGFKDIDILRTEAASELEAETKLRALHDETVRLLTGKEYNKAAAMLKEILTLRPGDRLGPQDEMIQKAKDPTVSVVAGSVCSLLGVTLLLWLASRLGFYSTTSATSLINFSAVSAFGLWVAGFVLLTVRPFRGKPGTRDASAFAGSICALVGITLLFADTIVTASSIDPSMYVHWVVEADVINLLAVLALILSLVGTCLLAARPIVRGPGRLHH
jgi:tRNA A-37 threonylcarbamoyl transferase component Bud32